MSFFAAHLVCHDPPLTLCLFRIISRICETSFSFQEQGSQIKLLYSRYSRRPYVGQSPRRNCHKIRKQRDRPWLTTGCPITLYEYSDVQNFRQFADPTLAQSPQQDVASWDVNECLPQDTQAWYGAHSSCSRWGLTPAVPLLAMIVFSRAEACIWSFVGERLCMFSRAVCRFWGCASCHLKITCRVTNRITGWPTSLSSGATCN